MPAQIHAATLNANRMPYIPKILARRLSAPSLNNAFSHGLSVEFMFGSRRSVLKRESCCQLNQTRSRRAEDLSEIRVVHFAVDRRRPVELGMVKHVERFEAKVEGFRFGQSQGFGKCHVEILDSRAVEKSPGHIPQLPKGLGAEGRGVERGAAISRIGVDIQRAPLYSGVSSK